ncbi:DUF192 domain-containing protein [Candidatus Pacearchaeota archaeon]|nr:DUF192 domain-containing protein [Candidatus Pacearchaeota archaeon]
MKLNKKSLFFKLIIFFILLFLIYFIISEILKFQNKSEEICIEEKACFEIEIADTSEKRISGLSNREFLEENKGMLFVFPEESVPGFWMKDMKFPLDIIWINRNLEIIGIDKNQIPCEENDCIILYPPSNILYVLEITSGLSEKYGFEIGNKISLN